MGQINQTIEKLISIYGEENIDLQADMKKHTSFKTGGRADLLIKPKSIEDIKTIISICKEDQTPYFIIGNGSNLLVSDDGIRGVVIKISNNMSSIEFNNDYVTVQAGATLPRIGIETYKRSLTGFEFAAGIPGTVGGAIVMNAGAHGGEMKDIVTMVKVLDKNGEIIELANEDLNFSYRHSCIEESEFIVLEVIFKLEKGEQSSIKLKMDELKEKRVTTQPLDKPNAGSTFKRPGEGLFAGKLIQDADIKGLEVNGAQISDKHAGFIVNKNNATTTDILNLIKIAKKSVKDKFGIELQEEVKILGL